MVVSAKPKSVVLLEGVDEKTVGWWENRSLR